MRLPCFYFAIQTTQASTPKDTLVMAFNIDDVISLDPAEIFEFFRC